MAAFTFQKIHIKTRPWGRDLEGKNKFVPFLVEVLGFNYCMYGNVFEFISCALLKFNRIFRGW